MAAGKKKTVTKKAAKKAVKKPAAKKSAAKRPAAKKTVRKAAPKAPAKKAPAKKPVKAAEAAASASMKLPLAVRKRQKQLTDILLQKRNEVVHGLEAQMGRKLTFDSSQRIDSAMDSADQSALDVDQGIDFSLQEMRYEQYKDIADAFRKLENGSYGMCEECGEEIAIKRLEVNPLARFCITCKTRKEEMEKIEREETRFKE